MTFTWKGTDILENLDWLVHRKVELVLILLLTLDTQNPLVPAIHADGSKLQIRIKISRESHGSTDGQILLKALIQRADESTEQLSEVGKMGFQSDMRVEITPNMTILNIESGLISTLGYDSTDFIGQNVAVLIPPGVDNSQNETWFKGICIKKYSI